MVKVGKFGRSAKFGENSNVLQLNKKFRQVHNSSIIFVVVNHYPTLSVFYNDVPFCKL